MTQQHWRDWGVESGRWRLCAGRLCPGSCRHRVADRRDGDIDRDGKDDLLWRKTDGSISTWAATGTGFAENSYVHGPVGAGWSVARWAT